MGSDAVLRSSVFFIFFEVVGIEGFLGFKNAVNDVKQLVHDGSDDFHFLLSLGSVLLTNLLLYQGLG